MLQYLSNLIPVDVNYSCQPMHSDAVFKINEIALATHNWLLASGFRSHAEDGCVEPKDADIMDLVRTVTWTQKNEDFVCLLVKACIWTNNISFICFSPSITSIKQLYMVGSHLHSSEPIWIPSPLIRKEILWQINCFQKDMKLYLRGLGRCQATETVPETLNVPTRQKQNHLQILVLACIRSTNSETLPGERRQQQ